MQTVDGKDGRPFTGAPAPGDDAGAPEAVAAHRLSGHPYRNRRRANRQGAGGLGALIAEAFARGERAAAAFCLVQRARLLARESRSDEARDTVRHGLASGTPEGRSFDRIGALSLASHIAKELRRAGRGRQACRGRRVGDALRDPLRDLSALLKDSNPERAVALFGESLEHGRDAGPDDLWRKAEDATQQGRLAEALSIYQGLARSEAEDDRKHRDHALANTALVRMRIGDMKGACATMDSAIDTFLDTGNPFTAADAMMRAVHFRRRAGIAHDDMVDRLVAFAEAQESPPHRRSIGTTAGRTAFDFNRLDAAEKLLTAALEIALSKDWRDMRDALTASDLLGGSVG